MVGVDKFSLFILHRRSKHNFVVKMLQLVNEMSVFNMYKKIILDNNLRILIS